MELYLNSGTVVNGTVVNGTVVNGIVFKLWNCG